MHLSIKIRTRLEHVNATLQNKLIKRKSETNFRNSFKISEETRYERQGKIVKGGQSVLRNGDERVIGAKRRVRVEELGSQRGGGIADQVGEGRLF